MRNFKDYWDETHKKYSMNKITYDNWLDNYKDALNKCTTKVLDLGCGSGNDSLYLSERGFKVIACDYSQVVLDKIKTELQNVETLNIDISEKLPFNDDSFDLIIADLSLHYFDEKTTLSIMSEIKRILRTNGKMIARVNSTDDINHGAGQGKKIEDNYYYVEGYNKRFFTIDDAKRFFSIIGDTKIRKANMLRYAKPKKVIEIETRKIDVKNL